MDLYTFMELLGVVGGCSLRSRLVQLPASGTVDFALDPSEQADYVLIFTIRGIGIGANARWQLISPPVAGTYDVVSDDFRVAIGGGRDTGLTVRFTNLTAIARQIEVDFARFNAGQLEDLRCLVGFPSPAALALTNDALQKAGITA